MSSIAMVENPDILKMLRGKETALERELELVRKQIREWEDHASGSGKPLVRLRGDEFTEMPPHVAVMKFMRRAEKSTRQEIIDAVIAGGLFGTHIVKDPAKSVNQAISTLVTKGELNEPHQKPGRPQKDSVILLGS